MTTKWQILVIIIITLAVIGGLAFYVFQPQLPKPSPTPTFTFIPTPTQTPTPTPTLSPTETPNEEARIKELLESYVRLYNGHSLDDLMTCFTEDAVVKETNGEERVWTGTRNIKARYSAAFKNYPEVRINVSEPIVHIVGGMAEANCLYDWITAKATVKGAYFIKFIKIDDAWRISLLEIRTSRPPASSNITPTPRTFDEAVKSLNTPELVSAFVHNNIHYRAETVNEYVPARIVFERKYDDCNGFATLQAYLLRANGYDAWNVGIAIETATGHNVCGYKHDGVWWVLDVEGAKKGPFNSLDELGDYYVRGGSIILFNPLDIRYVSNNSFALPHTVFRK